MEFFLFGFIGCVIAVSIIGAYRGTGRRFPRRGGDSGAGPMVFWHSSNSSHFPHDSHHDHGHTHHAGCGHGGHDSGGGDSGGGDCGGGGDGGGGGGGD